MPTPAGGPITQYFGPTDEPLDSGALGYPHFNKGVDYGGNLGDPVTAVAGGTVIQAGEGKDGWGISVKVRMDDGRIVNYGHLSGVNVSVGQRLNGGETIGAIGSTGASTGPHLSFDVMDSSGNPLDPSDLLGFAAGRDNRTGQPFGDGSTGGGSDGGTFDFSQYDIPALPFSTADYYTKLARWNALDRKVATYEDQWNAYQKAMSNFSGYDEMGNPVAPPDEPVNPLTPDEEAEYTSLGDNLDNWEMTYQQQGADLDRLLTLLDHYSKTDPRLIDAENAADKFSRELDVRQEARQAATAQYQEQTDRQNAAFDQNNAMLAGQTRLVMAPALKLTPYEELYAKARDMVASGMPDVPDKPYPYRLGAGQLGALTRPAAPGPTRSASAFGGRLPEEGDPNRAGNGSGRLPVSTIAPQPSSSPAMSRASFLDKFDLKGSGQPVRDTSAFRLADDLASRQYGPAAPNIPTQRMMPFTPTATQTPNRGVGPSYNRTAGTITPSIFR